MKSQTSLVAADTRLQQWAMQVRDCRNRPAGMDVTTWCSQNNISKANYYYRLRRVRKAYLKMTGTEQPPEFVELPQHSATLETPIPPVTSPDSAAVLVLANGLRVEITNQASEQLLQALLGAATHVK